MSAPTNAEMEKLLRNARESIDACLQLLAAGSATGRASGASKPAAASGARASNGARFDEVRAVFLKEVMERTGYPEEMLDLDLDLEGELGIDTVKQVAILGAVREHFGLEIDKSFKLRDHNTMRKAIQYVAGRLDGTGAASRS